MIDPNLQAVLNQIEAGKTLSQRDLQVLKRAVRSRQVTIQGSADRAVIVTGDGNVVGDRNLVIAGADAKTLRFLLNERDRSLTILLQVVKEEVQSRLDQSLHNAVLINLGKEAQSQQVHHPWNAEVKIGAKPSEPLPSEISILEVFERSDIAGKLLILGEPGSGKTTTMLDLAQALTEKAEIDPNYPIPVLLNLSAWKDTRQQMKDWLIAELKSKYGVRSDIGKKWIEEKQLLLLLDGLDEVRSEHQIICVQAINQMLQSENRPSYLVVCSRREEYEAYSEKLNLNGAIELQDLTNTQIQSYLRAAKRLELLCSLQKDVDLLEMIRKPLLLSIVLLLYGEQEIKQMNHMTSTSVRLELVLDGYVQSMLSREFRSQAYKRCQPPSIEITKYWLAYVAVQLEQQQTDFLIEKIQPSILEALSVKDPFLNSRNVYDLSVFICVTSIFSPLCYVSTQVEITSRSSMLFSIVSGAILLGVSTYRAKIEIIETLSSKKIFFENWSHTKAKESWFTALMISTITLAITSAWNMEITVMLLIVLVVSYVVALVGGIDSVEIESRVIPNQGIQKSLQSAFLTFFLGLSIGFIACVNQLLSLRFYTSPILIYGLSFILILSLRFGGQACIQHFVLRLVLFSNGYIPWNYRRSLDYATELSLLQKIGGRYIFIHPLLRKRFESYGQG